MNYPTIEERIQAGETPVYYVQVPGPEGELVLEEREGFDPEDDPRARAE
jgi:hypothetical protein